MPWKVEDPKRYVSRREWAFLGANDYDIRAEPDPNRIKQLRAEIDEDEARGIYDTHSSLELLRLTHFDKADYDIYRKEEIELKIQKAIARAAALHDIFDF